MVPDFCVFISPLAYIYAAAAAGVLLAHLALAWLSHRGQTPSVIEANWIALLPMVAVVLLPVIVPLSFVPVPGLPSLLHGSGHRWEAMLAQPPLVHVSLYIANIGLLAYVVSNIVLTLRGMIRAHLTLCSLRSVSRRDGNIDTSCRLPVYVVAEEEPLCFTAGLLRPVVYVSQGLLALLNANQRDIVLAHEAAHGRRRDSLLGCVLAVFYGVFRMPGVTSLTTVWRSASERACDADAAKQCGSACEVAAVIVMIAQLAVPARRTIPDGVYSFMPSSGSEIEARVAALLQLVPESGPVQQTSPLNAQLQNCSLAPALLIGVFGADYVIQHVVEFFIVH